MKTIKLSPSTLNLFLECPKCFWLQMIKGIKRPNGIFPSLPSGMDIIIKRYFDRCMEMGIMPPELGCPDNYKLFDNKELLNLWRNNFKGISFIDKNGNVLHGSIDSLLVKDGKLIVLDFKTRGFALKENTADYYKTQLDIYNFLLRKNGYETEDYALLLFYIPKEILPTGEVIFNTQVVMIKTDVKNAEEIFNKAIDLLNRDCPKKTCEWCKFIKNK